ncbi:MAG: PAS domain-containing protein [Candidatus Endobugula sp.]
MSHLLVGGSNRLWLNWLFGITILSFSACGYSGVSVVNLVDASESYDLNNHISYIEDSSNQLTIEQVSAIDFVDDFNAIKSNTLNRGYSASAYWLTFTLSNKSATIKRWNLVFRVPDSLRVDLYSPEADGQFSVIQSGMSIPLKDRIIPIVPIVLPVKVALGETKTFYINYLHGYKSHINLKLHSVDSSKAIHQKKIKTEYFYSGFVIALLLYSLVLLITLRDVSYLYYILFYLCYFGVRYSHTAVYLQFIAAEHSIWIHYLTLTFGALAAIFALQFARSFLSSNKVIPWFDRFILLMMALFVLEIVLIFFIPIAQLRPIHHGLAALAYCLVPVASIVCWRLGVKHALYLAIAWTPFVLGFVFFMAQWSGALPVVRLEGGGALMLFASIEMISWSFALAGRIKTLRQEKRHAQLEEKITKQENEGLLREMIRREYAEKEILQSKSQLIALLDSSQEAIVVFNNKGEVSFSNRVVGQLLGLKGNEHSIKNIASLCDNNIDITQLIESDHADVEGDMGTLQLTRSHGESKKIMLTARLLRLHQLDNTHYALVLWREKIANEQVEPLYDRLLVVKEALTGVISFFPQSEVRHKSTGKNDVEFVESLSKEEFTDVFRRALVEVMCLSMDYWEQSTRKTRFDLAEQSGVWRIYQDRGTLNTKTMDRYLSLQKIPQNPRWKDVVHTANFVLEDGSIIEGLTPLRGSLEKALLYLNSLSLSKRVNY